MDGISMSGFTTSARRIGHCALNSTTMGRSARMHLHSKAMAEPPTLAALDKNKPTSEAEEKDSSRLASDTSDSRGAHSAPKPRRPPNAYSLFFRQERKKLMGRSGGDVLAGGASGLLDKIIANGGGLGSNGNVSSDDEGSSPVSGAADGIVSSATSAAPGTAATLGKLGANEVAREISRKWRELDESSRSVFEALALLEKKKFDREMEMWNRERRAVDERQHKKIGAAATFSLTSSSLAASKAPVPALAGSKRRRYGGGAHRSSASGIDNGNNDDDNIEGDSTARMKRRCRAVLERNGDKSVAVGPAVPVASFVVSATSLAATDPLRSKQVLPHMLGRGVGRFGVPRHVMNRAFSKSGGGSGSKKADKKGNSQPQLQLQKQKKSRYTISKEKRDTDDSKISSQPTMASPYNRFGVPETVFERMQRQGEQMSTRQAETTPLPLDTSSANGSENARCTSIRSLNLANTMQLGRFNTSINRNQVHEAVHKLISNESLANANDDTNAVHDQLRTGAGTSTASDYSFDLFQNFSPSSIRHSMANEGDIASALELIRPLEKNAFAASSLHAQATSASKRLPIVDDPAALFGTFTQLPCPQQMKSCQYSNPILASRNDAHCVSSTGSLCPCPNASETLPSKSPAPPEHWTEECEPTPIMPGYAGGVVGSSLSTSRAAVCSPSETGNNIQDVEEDTETDFRKSIADIFGISADDDDDDVDSPNDSSHCRDQDVVPHIDSQDAITSVMNTQASTIESDPLLWMDGRSNEDNSLDSDSIDFLMEFRSSGLFTFMCSQNSSPLFRGCSFLPTPKHCSLLGHVEIVPTLGTNRKNGL